VHRRQRRHAVLVALPDLLHRGRAFRGQKELRGFPTCRAPSTSKGLFMPSAFQLSRSW
jgi:hypothetical protein